MKAQRDDGRLMDVNGDPGSSNVCDADDPNHPAGTRRYFYHQDRNWNVVAVSEYDDGAGTNGRIAERYAYTPYGEFVVLKGDGGNGEQGRTLCVSTIGNNLCRRGGVIDQETGKTSQRSARCNRGHGGRQVAGREPAQWSGPCATGTCNGLGPRGERDRVACCAAETADCHEFPCRPTQPSDPERAIMLHYGTQAVEFFCELAPDRESCCPVPCAPDVVCTGTAFLSCNPSVTCPAEAPIRCIVCWEASYGCSYGTMPVPPAPKPVR